MKIISGSAILLLFAAMLTGCASRSMHMVARRNSPDAPTSLDGIVLARHPQPPPEEQRLNRVLTEVLKRDGLTAKSAADADYTLAYWIEQSWDEVLPVHSPVQQEEYKLTVVHSGDPTGGRMAGESFHPLKSDELGPRYISKKGVKLRLYSNHAPAASRLTPVWEGYIEISSAQSSAQLKAAVENLLTHLGKDFSGNVRL